MILHQMMIEMNARIQFIYELCGLLLIVFAIISFVTVFWNLFVTVNFTIFALVVFIIRKILEFKYGELWKKLFENEK